MTDPYRITEPPETPRPLRRPAVRAVLWLLLVISAAGNVVTSTAGAEVYVGAAFGVATLACGSALIVQHYRLRRR